MPYITTTTCLAGYSVSTATTGVFYAQASCFPYAADCTTSYTTLNPSELEAWQQQWMNEQAGWQNMGWQSLTQQTLHAAALQQQRNIEGRELVVAESLANEASRIIQATPVAIIPKTTKEARDRARGLLLEFLDDSQTEDFEKSESFILRTLTRSYRIKPGDRVEEIRDDGIVVARFCIHPSYELGCPPEDWALTQKFLIEDDEEAFRRNANRSAA